MSISIVMPLYLLDAALEQMTLESIASLKGHYDELILVDDGSPYHSTRLQEQADCYIRFTTNHGTVRAVNTGIDAARSTHIVYANNDTLLLEGQLTTLCRTGYVFPKLETQEWMIPHEHWTAAFACFPKGLGKEREEYFMYFADLDLYLRAQHDHIPLEYEPSVVVRHLHSVTVNKTGKKMERYAKDRAVFVDLWGYDPD